MPGGEIGTEIGQVVPFGPQVVVHGVQDHGEAAGVARIHQTPKSDRSAVRRLRCEQADTVVPPVPGAWKAGHGHEFDGRDAEVPKILQAGHDGREGALRREGPDMDLITHQVATMHAAPAGIRPGEGRRVHDLGWFVHAVRLGP